jgi:hypothetical protein
MRALSGRTQAREQAPREPRAQRRETGRRRHKETGAPAWTASDRSPRPPRVRLLDDAGGLGMGYGMQRSIVEDDEDEPDER